MSIPAAPAIDAHTFAVYDYGNPLVQRAVRDLKYHRNAPSAHVLAKHGIDTIIEWLGEMLQSTSPEQVILVPIPQHTSKTAARGFNQAALLAEWIASSFPGARVKNVLTKVTLTMPQAHTSSKTMRLKNVGHSMRAAESLDPSLFYLIVDDVITTGATVHEATRALRDSGARKILAVSLAHGYSHHHKNK